MLYNITKHLFCIRLFSSIKLLLNERRYFKKEKKLLTII